jgi:phospholipid/cholesterol/gamma-HCH transport system substrate-binding protein
VRALAAFTLLAAAAVALLLALNSGGYMVHAEFTSAAQVVKGAEVQIAGRRVGTVTSVGLGSGWKAVLDLDIDPAVAPLREGTTAVIRQVSLSGVANRYVDLQMPPGNQQHTIPDGGIIDTQHTRPVVDVDQLFNTLQPRDRRGLREIVRGFGDQIDGRSSQAAAGFGYLDPSLAANGRLFAELTRDRPALERFVVDNAKLASDVAARRDALSGLVDQLANFTGTLGRRRAELGRSIELLPTFLRRANTTFVNLRGTLDDLQPTLVNDAGPVAHRLGPVLAQLRPFAHEARPTLASRAAALRSPGRADDLVDVTRSAVPLRDQLVRTAQRDGAQRRGTLPELTDALAGQTPAFADLRPYAPDLVGWFDDFSHSGLLDANGGVSRTSLTTNAFTSVNGVLTPVPLDLRQPVLRATAALGQNNRCPGAAEHRASDGSNPNRPTDDFNCDPNQVLPGK